VDKFDSMFLIDKLLYGGNKVLPSITEEEAQEKKEKKEGKKPSTKFYKE